MTRSPLAAVTGWSVQGAAVYARQELATCAERAKHRFTLDLSLLEQGFGIKLPSANSTRGGGSWLGRPLGASR